MKTVVLVLLLAAVIYVVGTLGITALVFHQSYRGYEIKKYSSIAPWSYYEDQFWRKKVGFDANGNELVGYFFGAKDDVPRKGTIVFSHGIWSGPDEYLTWITWLARQGWTVFAYTYTAYNGSEGTWAKGLPESMIDLNAALTYLEGEEGKAQLAGIDDKLLALPKVVMGHSWGAYATASVLTKGHDVDGAVVLSGFSDPVEISVSVAKNMLGPVGSTMGWAVNLINKILFGPDSRVKGVDGINQAGIPVLVLHGENDAFIGYDTTSILSHQKEITNPKVQYITLDDPKQSAHNNYFCNADATAYYDEIAEEYEALEATFPKKKVPDEEQKRFYEKVDIPRANQPNEALLQQVEAFLEKHIE